MSPEESEYIGALYDQYSESLWRYALVCVKDRALADELVSDVFHAASENPQQVMTYEPPFKWLIGTLKKKIKKSAYMRQRYALLFLSLDDETLDAHFTSDSRPTEDQAALESSPTAEVKAKIETVLTPKELYILRRITLNKASHKAVSQELEISIWDSYKNLERIRKKLSKVFPGHPRRKKKK